jgi:diguanylate cyclase (GGDEF)-like protein
VEKILIVEDSKTVSLGLKRWIQRDLGLECDVARSLAQAREMVEENGREYFIALLDLHLPDAPNGEVVDFMIGADIPSVVVTGAYDPETRKMVMHKNVVDYVVKSHPRDMPQLLKLIKRIANNRNTRVLVVDDSRQFRNHYGRVLQNQRLRVHTAEDGIQAMDILKKHPDIRLVLTDYHMPRMNGYELVQEIRKRFSEDMLAIIVFSTDDTENMAPKFLKVGANDFISKASSIEEFLCRINMNLNVLDMMHEIKESAYRDFLTKIYNRKYFFEQAEQIYPAHRSRGKPLVVAMLDIDLFKRVNDVYGHYAGDMVIKAMAKLLENACRERGIVARFGGEEFCMLLTTMPENGIVDFFESLRAHVENEAVLVDNQEIRFTASLGVTSSFGGSLADMINRADQLLYDAKQSGRNRVCFD